MNSIFIQSCPHFFLSFINNTKKNYKEKYMNSWYFRMSWFFCSLSTQYMWKVNKEEKISFLNETPKHQCLRIRFFGNYCEYYFKVWRNMCFLANYRFILGVLKHWMLIILGYFIFLCEVIGFSGWKINVLCEWSVLLLLSGDMDFTGMRCWGYRAWEIFKIFYSEMRITSKAVLRTLYACKT